MKKTMVTGSLGTSGLFGETAPSNPRSPYSASKASINHLVTAWHHTYGLPTVVTNCSNNYGSYRFPEKPIPLAILNALDGQPLPIYGKGDNIRDWLYVDDHARALMRVEAGRVGERRRRKTSTPASAGRSSGISTMNGGGGRFARRAMQGNGLVVISPFLGTLND